MSIHKAREREREREIERDIEREREGVRERKVNRHTGRESWFVKYRCTIEKADYIANSLFPKPHYPVGEKS